LVYIINDIKDSDSDKLHPLKNLIKPIANKSISEKNAFFLIFFLALIISIYLFYYDKFLIYFVIYLILNIFYSFYLKNVPIADILAIALGYNIRVELGSEAINVNTTPLMHLSIFFLAIFILAGKKKGENNTMSKFQNKYDNTSLSYFSNISIILAIGFYIIYILDKNISLLYTVPLVIFIIFRYIVLSNNPKLAEFPIDIVTKDLQILLGISLYFVSVIFLLY